MTKQVTDTKRYITVHGIASHGGFGMSNDGCDHVSEHHGYTDDESHWKDIRWMTTEDDWEGDDRDVRDIITKVSEVMELTPDASKAVWTALQTRAEDTPIVCGGHWGGLWEVKDDDFWDRAPEAPKCPDCNKPMTLDRYAHDDTNMERVVAVTGKDTRHWLYNHCWSHAVIDSGEAIDDDDV